MCGIVGIVAADAAGLEESLTRATATIVHRGPDDGGHHLFRLGAGHAGFGFRRLAILDLTAAGHQPMIHPATGDALIFNGEIYNFAALRHELSARGVMFRGHSDSEVLLHALVAWGADVLPRLHGMYAFAFHDRRSDRILLARDPLGIKPLYVARHGDRVVFGSEVRSLLATGLVPDDLDPAGVASLLAYGAPQDPFTIHRHVRSLPAGSCEWIAGGGNPPPPRRRFWTFPEIRPPRGGPAGSEPQALRGLLDEAVRDHLVSDVPIGVFLSAGLDSTILAALATRHAGSVRTFTVGYDEPGVADELAGAALAARSIGSRHEEIVLSRHRIAALWPAWMAAADRPSIDGLNTFIICRAVKEAGLTVALSGLGSDELFGGYGSFANAARYLRAARGLRLLPGPIRRLALAAAVRAMPAAARAKATDMFGECTNLADVALQIRRVFSNSEVRRLGVDATAVGLPPHYLDPEALSEALGTAAESDPFAIVSRLETRLYMGNTLLRDTDVNSMASSLEVRVPFLAQPLVDHVATLPHGVRSPPGAAPKHLLRAACGDLIPEPLLRRPKTGFTLPIDRWMRGPMRDACAAAVDVAADCGLLDPRAVRGVWAEFTATDSRLRWTKPLALVALGGSLRAGSSARCAPSR